MSLQKNQDIQLNIEGYTAEGNGVGHYNGQAVFVSGAAKGDTIIAHIIKAKKTYAVGIIKQILKKSPNRIDVDCQHFRSCGGCVYRHISYEAEKQLKRQKVIDAFTRLAHIDVPVKDIVTCETERYRNKAQYPVGFDKEIVAGFYAQKSHRIINSSDCVLQPEEFSKIVEIVKKWMTEFGISAYDSINHEGLIRHIYIRKAFVTGQIMVCLVINGDKIPKSQELVDDLLKIKGLASVTLNKNTEKTNVILGLECKTLWGNDYIEDILCGVKIRLSPLSFYQVNHDCAELLYKKALDYVGAKGDGTILDLYCGAGTIGLSMAKDVKKVIGVEIIPEAIEDAKENAKRNNIENCEFYCGDAKDAVKILKKQNIEPDAVILDPPRKGCDKEVLEYVAEMKPKKIVYVSCDVSTQARDCAILKELGYETKEVTPVDMFPRTSHTETVALLSRQIDVHKMKLYSAPFEMIKSGKKTIELRLYDEKRQQIKVGDKIVFTNTVTGEKLDTTVLELHRFESFEELYKSLSLLKCGYTTEDIDKATPVDMEQYYSVEEQKKFGVVGIELLTKC